MVDESAEKHRYESSLAREKRAFEQLIAAKETMVVSLPDSAADLEQARLEEELGDTRQERRRREAQSRVLKVVVDLRDFRSSLPALLYAAGFTVLPRTLCVGDFVLSPDICVERKGVSDLFQSLASGRLYAQVSRSLCVVIAD